MADESISREVFELLIFLLRLLWETLKAVFRVFVPPSAKDVKGQIILITGAGHGMGREMALRFAKLDAVVVCVDINAKGNEETNRMIKKFNKEAHIYECDVTNRAAVMELADRVMKEVGDVTILVNNAGIMPSKPLIRQSEKEIKSTVDINVLGILWMIQAFLPKMIENNRGHLVSMSSIAGFKASENLVPYCGTKFAVRGIMEGLAMELRNFNIKLTTICPYMVDTGLCKKPTFRWQQLTLMKVGEASDMIVDAIRREYIEVTIPHYQHYVYRYILKLLPMGIDVPLLEFLKIGVDAEDL